MGGQSHCSIASEKCCYDDSYDQGTVKEGNMKNAKILFDEIQRVSWNAIITGIPNTEH